MKESLKILYLHKFTLNTKWPCTILDINNRGKGGAQRS